MQDLAIAFPLLLFISNAGCCAMRQHLTSKRFL